MKHRFRLAARAIAITIASGALAISAPAAAKSCDAPAEKPEIPAGEAATKEQMEAASAAVRKFLAGTQEYMACLEFPPMDNKDTASYNKAAEMMEKLAKQFNAELKSFKAKNG